jgi:hypothetical protein
MEQSPANNKPVVMPAKAGIQFVEFHGSRHTPG